MIMGGKVAFDRLSPRGREDAAGKCGCRIVTSSSLPRFLASLLTAVSRTNKAACLPIPATARLHLAA